MTIKHNLSETDVFPSADDGEGDTYSVGPLRKRQPPQSLDPFLRGPTE
jgi:hypothetical protein